MKNPLIVIENLLKNVSGKNEMVFIDPNGSIVPISEMIGKSIEKGWKLEERSVDDSKKAVIEQLFGEEKISMKSYRQYIDTLTNLAKFVELNIESPLKSNLKKNGLKSMGQVDFTNLKYENL